MTTEELQKRIVAITNEMAQVRSAYAKLEGHLGEAQFWLSEKLKPAVDHIKDLAEKGLSQENLGDESNGEADKQAEEQTAQE